MKIRTYVTLAVEEAVEVMEAEAETYEDHRMAMAFTLTGLKTGVITIEDPQCCKKTFEDYFQIIDGITSQSKER